MIKATIYAKDKGLWRHGLIKNFTRLQSVRPYINDDSLRVVAGRYNSGTYMDEALFSLFQRWLRREPLPLIARQEREIGSFLNCFYDDVVGQFPLGTYRYDFYVPAHNLLVEYNEKEHLYNTEVKRNDRAKAALATAAGYAFETIAEASAFRDLARIARHYKS